MTAMGCGLIAMAQLARLWVVGFLVLVERALAVSHVCEFGQLPGYWNMSAPRGYRYQLIDPECQLQPLLEYKHSSEALGVKQRKSLLMLGDSNNRKQIESLCIRWNTTYNMVWEGWLAPNTSYYCGDSTKGDVLTKMLPGVSLSGPYYNNANGSAIHRSTLAIEAFMERFEGRLPRAVLFQSNLWDLARMVEFESDMIGLSPCKDVLGEEVCEVKDQCSKQHQCWQEKCKDGKCAKGDCPPLDVMCQKGALHLPKQISLPHWVLQDWMANFTALVNHVRQTLPPHDDSLAGMDARGGRFGRARFQADLNAAGRHIAKQLGLHIIDAEAMVSGLNFKEYLQDEWHAAFYVLDEISNIAFNLEAQHARLTHLRRTRQTHYNARERS